MRVLIVGCGYVGTQVGLELIRLGHEVHGLRRSFSAELEQEGIKSVVGDITDPSQLDSLPGPYDWVVNTASSGRSGMDTYEQVYLNGTRNLIGWLKGQSDCRYVYTSSTGVYGQDDGSTVVESDVTDPPGDTGKILVATERLILDAAPAFKGIVLRVSGIYGPGRGYFYRQFLKGEARLSPAGSRILNMVHRDDVAGAVVAALQKGDPGQVYNVVDDEPIDQREFATWLAAILEKPLPPESDDVGRVGKRLITNKRILNSKLKSDLNYRFKYPTFREGYRALIEADD